MKVNCVNNYSVFASKNNEKKPWVCATFSRGKIDIVKRDAELNLVKKETSNSKLFAAILVALFIAAGVFICNIDKHSQDDDYKLFRAYR
jgi:hypothetical protein